MVSNKEEQLRILGERGEEIRQGESELSNEKRGLRELENQKINLKGTITIETGNKYSNEYLAIFNKAREETIRKIREDFLDEKLEKKEAEIRNMEKEKERLEQWLKENPEKSEVYNSNNEKFKRVESKIEYEKRQLEFLKTYIRDKQIQSLFKTSEEEKRQLYEEERKTIERNLKEELETKKQKEIEEQVKIQGEELDRKIEAQKAKVESLEIALNEKKEQLQNEIEEELVNESENIEEGEQLERDLHAKRKNLFNELASKEIVNRELENLRNQFENELNQEKEGRRIEKEQLETELTNLKDKVRIDKEELVNKLEEERKAKNTANNSLNEKNGEIENVNYQLTRAQEKITNLKKQLGIKEKAEQDRRENNLSYLSEIKEYGNDIFNLIPSGGKLILFIILLIPLLWILKYVFRLLNWVKKIIIDVWTEIRNIFPKSTKGKKTEIKKSVEVLEVEEEPTYKGKKRGRKKKTEKK